MTESIGKQLKGLDKSSTSSANQTINQRGRVGVLNDRESKILHATHVAWNAIARLYLLSKAKERKRTNERLDGK